MDKITARANGAELEALGLIDRAEGHACEREVETRSGIEPLEALHAKRRAIIKTVADLELFFGGGRKTWESTRKRHRAGIARLIEQEQGPMAENKLERMANSDERHTKYCDRIEGQFAEWMNLKTALSEIEERIESRLAELRYLTAEARLT